MDISTKDRILNEALVLFAEKGYKGANLRDLAARLGLSKSALYKHYDSKEHIWNALLDRMIEYYGGRMGSQEHLPEIPEDEEGLVRLSLGMIRFTVQDPRIIMTRKLLLTEQFHDPRVRRMATQYFLEGMTGLFRKVFEGMMAKGIMRRSDPAMLAFSFTAPISALIHNCDREPDRHEEAFLQMERFIRFFCSTHLVQ